MSIQGYNSLLLNNPFSYFRVSCTNISEYKTIVIAGWELSFMVNGCNWSQHTTDLPGYHFGTHSV